MKKSIKTKKISAKEFNKIYRRAEKAEKRGDYETEILLLDQLLEADPYDYEILNKKGLVQFRLGKTKSAIDHLNKVSDTALPMWPLTQTLRWCFSPKDG